PLDLFQRSSGQRGPIWTLLVPIPQRLRDMQPVCRHGSVAPHPYTPSAEDKEQQLMDSKLPVISLFSGAGGLDLAVEFAGGTVDEPMPGPLRVAVATDYEADALRTFSENFPDVPTVLRDSRALPTEELLEVAGLRKGEPTLVIGGPP